MHRDVAVAPQFEPSGFRAGATPTPHAAWPQLRTLVHPAAVTIAVDPGGREITEPGQAGDRCDVLAMAVEYRIARLVRRHRQQDMRRAGECGGLERVVAIEAKPAECRAH